MKDFNDKARPPPDHQKELVKLIHSLGYRHSHWQVFSEFVEMGAISISNAVDLTNQEKRESRYMEVIKRYGVDELQTFPTLKPFTGFKIMWHSYDYLAISGKWSRNRLVELAIKNSEEVGSTFEDSFPTTLAYLHRDLRNKQGID